jgi:hypothetical protein
MNKRVFLAGILSIMLVFGLVLIGCDDGTTDSGRTSGTGENSSKGV